MPCIVSRVCEVSEAEVAKKALADFMALFSQSSIRVTEGRAHVVSEAEVSEPFLAALEKFGGPFSVRLSAENAAKYPDAEKSMKASTYGIASSHVSIYARCS